MAVPSDAEGSPVADAVAVGPTTAVLRPLLSPPVLDWFEIGTGGADDARVGWKSSPDGPTAVTPTPPNPNKGIVDFHAALVLALGRPAPETVNDTGTAAGGLPVAVEVAAGSAGREGSLRRRSLTEVSAPPPRAVFPRTAKGFRDPKRPAEGLPAAVEVLPGSAGGGGMVIWTGAAPGTAEDELLATVECAASWLFEGELWVAAVAVSGGTEGPPRADAVAEGFTGALGLVFLLSGPLGAGGTAVAVVAGRGGLVPDCPEPLPCGPEARSTKRSVLWFQIQRSACPHP